MCQPQCTSVNPAWAKSDDVAGRRSSQTRQTRGDYSRTLRTLSGRERGRPGGAYSGDYLLGVPRQCERDYGGTQSAPTDYPRHEFHWTLVGRPRFQGILTERTAEGKLKVVTFFI